MAKVKDMPGVAPDGLPVRVDGDAPPPPPHGTPRKLAAADVAGPLPRVCGALDRVPPGSAAKRFKCRVTNYPTHATPKYVLALDRDSAKACMADASGLTAHLAALKADGAPAAELVEPRVVVTELAD